jgi:hypothetical protein
MVSSFKLLQRSNGECELVGDDKVTTRTLLEKLFKTGSISRFITHNRNHMKRVAFHTYINQLCAEKGTVSERIILKSDIARTYGHQIFSGARKPSRDKVIQLAFGFEMNYEEAQELLKAARKTPLYPKIERDAAIIYALGKRLTAVETQVMLDELSLPILGKDDKYE